MLLASVDESYNATEYWIAALLCPEQTVRPLTEALDNVVARAGDTYGEVDRGAELHGYDLFHGKKDWLPLAPMPRARIGIYNDAFAALASLDVEIIIRGVDIPRLRQRYVRPEQPHAVVFSHLLERIDERAEHLGQPALVIADEVDQADLYRRNLWHFQRFATSGYRARQLVNIVDTIHFAPSGASRMLQAVDLVAYLFFRMRSNVDRDPRAVRANEALWARISDHVIHQHCWWP